MAEPWQLENPWLGETDDDFEPDDDRDPEDSALGEFFLCGCDTPGCLMPGPHFASECHTVEMVEAWEEEASKPTCACECGCQARVQHRGDKCGMCAEACFCGSLEE